MGLEFLPIVCGCVAAGWFLFNLAAAVMQRDVAPLHRAAARAPDPQRPPRVTVVIAARNERERIAESVRRLLAQRGVELEIVVVDDRSEDGTREILEELQRSDPRLQVLRVDPLPAEWLGKQHACHVGALQAKGEWILFTDADTWMQPDLIASTIRAAGAAGADLACLLPAQKRIDLAGRAAVLVFSLGLLIAASRANRDRPRSPVGIGAFNLVRAEIYRKAGGYEALRMEVIDDLKLGLLIQRAGGRLRCWTAADHAEMDWAASPMELIHALEKNFFALVDFRFAVATVAIVTMFGAWLTAILGPLSGHWTGWVAFASLFTMAVPAALVARHSRWGLLAPLLAPLVYPVIPWTLLRSTWVTWRQGGIRWRGTLYELGLLRKHLVPLFARATTTGRGVRRPVR